MMGEENVWKSEEKTCELGESDFFFGRKKIFFSVLSFVVNKGVTHRRRNFDV